MNDRAEFEVKEREAIYRAIATRRDVRRGFLEKPLPDELIRRLLSAAHCAPSVGLMQPSRFVLVRDYDVRRAVHEAFLQANERALATYTGDRREHESDDSAGGHQGGPPSSREMSQSHGPSL